MANPGWLWLTGRDDGLPVLVPVARIFFVTQQPGGGCDIGVDAHDPVVINVAESAQAISNKILVPWGDR